MAPLPTHRGPRASLRRTASAPCSPVRARVIAAGLSDHRSAVLTGPGLASDTTTRLPARNPRLTAIITRIYAAANTLSSGGARTAGIDGVDRDRMEGNLLAELSNIRTELLAGTYEPLPARRVYIPKASDKTKLRPLGIRASAIELWSGPC